MTWTFEPCQKYSLFLRHPAPEPKQKKALIPGKSGRKRWHGLTAHDTRVGRPCHLARAKTSLPLFSQKTPGLPAHGFNTSMAKNLENPEQRRKEVRNYTEHAAEQGVYHE